MKKLASLILALGLAVSLGPIWGCGGDDGNGGGGDIPPATITQASVEDMVSDILEMLSPYDGMLGMGMMGGLPFSFAPPGLRPQATFEEGCMTITVPDDYMSSSSFTITIELDNCNEATDGIGGSGTIEMTISAGSGNNFSVNGSIDITDGSEFIDMEFSFSGSEGQESGTMTVSMEGSMSDPDNPGETYNLDITESISYSGDDYTIDMDGDLGGSATGQVSVEIDGLSYSPSQCNGDYPYAGSITISSGTDTAVVTITGCGTASITINGADQGEIDLG